jgi:ABC-type amino acid transport substrate-binding protein
MAKHASTPQRPNAATRRARRACLPVVALCAAGLVGAGQSAQAQELCSSYTVVSGDTLSRIAADAGVSGGFQRLFDVNRDKLSSPNRIEIGQVLRIPCADGALPDSADEPAPAETAITPVPERVLATPEAPRPLRVITASGYAPFTDESLEGGGLFTQLVLRSLEIGVPDQDISFFFVNDWNSQLNSLLPSGAIDMAFPWFKPDCSRVELLSPRNAYRCTDFNHSDPFYDALVGYFALAGNAYADAQTYDDLAGARLCRPDAWFTFDLEAEGLVAPRISLLQAPSQVACFEALVAGEVDVVTYDVLPAEEDIRTMGLSDRVVKIDALASSQTLHVFVAKDNEFANEMLAPLNAGLASLRESGEWFSIVRAGVQQAVEN